MSIQENDIVFGKNRQQYTLGKEVGAGGEGRVYKVNGQNLVAKIYKNVDSETVQKITYMVDHRISDLTDDTGHPILNLAWPQDILFDRDGHFVGYVMPFVREGVEICTVARGCDMPKAQALFPDYNWLVNLRVAVNLARAVNYLHERNCIIGDMNCKNIMVAGDCSITILDNDSFDLVDGVSGAHYRCCAGTQDYLAPELQGRSLRSPGAVFSVFSDDFSLAIHIFQLLMNNFHPFTGKNLVVIRNSTAVNQRLEHLATGKCPFVNSYADLTIPIGAPILAEMMPPQLVEDFRRTFNYDFSTIRSAMHERTTAAQWYAHLQAYLNQFSRPDQSVRCAANPRHYYLHQLGKCGLCSADHRLQAFRDQQAASRTPGVPPRDSQPLHTPQQSQQTNQIQPPRQAPAQAAPVPPAAASAAKPKGRTIGIVVFCAAIVLTMLFGYIMDNYGPSDSPNRSTGGSATGPTAHVHEWVPAEYNFPSYCSGCMQTQGDVKGYIGDIDGNWEELSLNGYDTHALHLNRSIRGLMKMTVICDIQIDKGSPCTEWSVYLLIDGQWTEKGVIYLPSGSGRGSVIISDKGTDWVEYVAVLPRYDGPEEITMGLSVTDAQEK